MPRSIPRSIKKVPTNLPEPSIDESMPYFPCLLLAAGEHKWFQLLFPTWVLLVSVVIL
jgi:hypothetical protein